MRTPGTRSSTRRSFNAGRVSARKDMLASVSDGETFVNKHWTLQELSQRWEASRIAALAVGILHGDEILPGEVKALESMRLLGFVERDSTDETPIMVGESPEFAIPETLIKCGEWLAVVEVEGKVKKLRYR